MCRKGEGNGEQFAKADSGLSFDEFGLKCFEDSPIKDVLQALERMPASPSRDCQLLHGHECNDVEPSRKVAYLPPSSSPASFQSPHHTVLFPVSISMLHACNLCNLQPVIC